MSPSSEDHCALRNIFSFSTWKLRSASDGKEATAILASEPVSVVICDRNLPDGSWRTLLEKVRNLSLPPRVIVCSREIDEFLLGEVLQSGGYDVLALPWHAKEVRQVIALAWRSWQFASQSAGDARLAAVGGS